MERANSKDVKLIPRATKLGVVCDLSLPTLELHDFNVVLPEKEEERDTTDEYRKNRTFSQQNRRDKNALF